jgi:hypothetical protein
MDADEEPAASSARPLGMQALQHRLRTGIGFLQLDAPVFELLEWDRRAGHCTTHEGSRPDDAKITIEILDLGLTRHGRAVIKAIQHVMPPSALLEALTKT